MAFSLSGVSKKLHRLRDLMTISKLFYSAAMNDSSSSDLWRVAFRSFDKRGDIFPDLVPYSRSTREVCHSLVQFRIEQEALERQRDYSEECEEEEPPRSIKGKLPDAPYTEQLDYLIQSRVVNDASALLDFSHGLAPADSIFQAQRGNVADSPMTKENAAVALRRYKQFLELKKSVGRANVLLVPTLDIEWAWISHILRTSMYWEDTQRLGVPPDHQLSLAPKDRPLFSEALAATAKLWQERFGDKYFEGEPPSHDPERGQLSAFVHVNMAARDKSGASVDLEVGLTVDDVWNDMKWIHHFDKAVPQLYQGSSENYGLGWDCFRNTFLWRLCRGYDRWLFLKSVYPDKHVPPETTIDLMWHAHQLNPVRYRDEVTRLLGYHLKHMMWGGRDAGESQPQRESTRALWNDKFKVEMGEFWKYDTY